MRRDFNSMSGQEMSWSCGPMNNVTPRLFLYLLVAVIFGWFSIPGYILLHAVTLSFAQGNRILVGIISLVILVVIFVWVPRFPAFSQVFSQVRIFREFRKFSNRIKLLASAGIGAGILNLIFLYAPPIIGKVVWALWLGVGVFMTLMGAYTFSSEGKLDRGSRTLTYRHRTMDLDTITGVKHFTLGNQTILWFSFTSTNDSSDAPRWVILPTDIADATTSFVNGRVEPSSD